MDPKKASARDETPSELADSIETALGSLLPRDDIDDAEGDDDQGQDSADDRERDPDDREGDNGHDGRGPTTILYEEMSSFATVEPEDEPQDLPPRGPDDLPYDPDGPIWKDGTLVGVGVPEDEPPDEDASNEDDGEP